MDIFNEERTAPTAPFRAVALTGNVLRHGVATRDGGRETLEFVVDLATVAPTRTPVVVDYNHDPAEIVGAARVRADGFALLADGELTPFLSDDRASEIISKAARGVPYGISPTFDFAAAERVDVAPGETFETNGRRVVGPVVVFRNAPLLGLSVCPYPTDDGTAFALLGKDFTLLTKGNEMAEEKNEKTTELKDDAANAPDGEGATGTSDAPSSVKNAELQEYVDRFGLELGVKYFQEGADLAEAVRIAVDSKAQNVSVCNAMETLLVHEKEAEAFLPLLAPELEKRGVEIRGDERTREIIPCKAATEEDWKTEYLDYVLSIRVVPSLDEAIRHINRYGSHHTDCIVTRSDERAADFMRRVDSAGVYRNVSTRFADGFVYGLGAEVGIATGKLHARGPMGLEGLTTYKYKLLGSGQTMEEMKKGVRSYTHRKLDEDCPL